MATRWIDDKPVDKPVKPNFEKAVNTSQDYVAKPVQPQRKSTGLEAKYKDAYTAWANKPDKTSTAALLRAVGPDIERGISATVGSANPLIRSRARLLALKAIKRYNPEEASLGTHIVNNLQSLKRVNREQTQIISVPERVFYDQNYLREAEMELELDSGKTPTDEELADHTGLSMRRIRHVRKFHQGISEGSMGTDDEDSEFSSAPAVLGRTVSAPYMQLVYDDVDSVDKKIMEWSFGMNGQPKLSGQAIAAKLRITPGAVSQRKAKIQGVLTKIMDHV